MAAAKPAPAWQSVALTDGDKAFVEALAGAIGSVVGTWCFYPLDTLKTRLQASTRVIHADGTSTRSAANLADVLRQAVREEGAAVLYDGIGVKTIYSLTQSFVYFYAFGFLRRKWENYLGGGGKIGVGASLLVGVMAGWCNVLITEPLDTIATAKQTRPLQRKLPLPPPPPPAAAAPGDGAPGGSRVKFDEVVASTSSAAPSSSVTKEIVPAGTVAGGPDSGLGAGTKGGAKGEPSGLYSGLWVSLLLTCNPAIQFTAFEQARRRLLAMRAAKGAGSGAALGKGSEMSAFDAFLLGAASKAFATVLTYPAIRAKVLLQTGRSQAASLAGTMRGVVERDGPTGLYKGLNAQLLKTVLVAALMLMVKEKSFGAAYVTVAWVRAQGARRRALAAPGKVA